jgi:hypothetical protein
MQKRRMERELVRTAADAMFHKLFRLFGRRDRAIAAEIEQEALLALEDDEAGNARAQDDLCSSSPFGPGFDCAEDVRFLP